MTSINNLRPGRPHALLTGFFLAALILVFAPAVHAAEPDTEPQRLEPYHYRPLMQAQEAVTRTIDTAREDGKLALIVLGAEWCHDSRAFGVRLSQPSMQDIIKESFVTQFVDVGYLEDRRAITAPLGYPINFGTPTVLVIDPQSGVLLNFADVSIWQNADSVPLEDYEHYFSSLAVNWSQGLVDPLINEPSVELQSFTDHNIQRLLAGYAALGPMLEDYDNDKLEDTESFEALWAEVRDFRAELQRNMTELRISEAGADGPAAGSEWPEYGPFSWELTEP